jgi:hypothetical protein
MTRWRAVGSGVLVGLGIDTVVNILFFGGTLLGIGEFYFLFHYASGVWSIVAGLAGGVVAGYLSASGVKSGGWHGLLAGAIGGLGIAIITIVITVVLARPSVGDLRTVIYFIGVYGLFTALYSLFTVIPSVIAGGIGATVHRRWMSAS